MDKSNLIVGNCMGIFFLILGSVGPIRDFCYTHCIISALIFLFTLVASLIIRKRDKKVTSMPLGSSYNVIHNTCSICGQTNCNHLRRRTDIGHPLDASNDELRRQRLYFMGVDYAGGIDRSRVSQWNGRDYYDQEARRYQEVRRHQGLTTQQDQQIRRYQELMMQQVALQPPQPIILTAQQNRRSNVSDNNNVYNDSAMDAMMRIYANNYGSNGQPPPQPEVKEIPTVEPISPRKILSAISTLELGE